MQPQLLKLDYGCVPVPIIPQLTWMERWSWAVKTAMKPTVGAPKAVTRVATEATKSKPSSNKVAAITERDASSGL